MLGVQPELGRFFHANDEHGPNSVPYVVLSDAYWRAHFAADPRIIGTKVDLNKQPFTVIGVAPPAFHGTELFLWPDFFVPIVNEQQIEGYNFLDKRYNHGTLCRRRNSSPALPSSRRPPTSTPSPRSWQNSIPARTTSMGVRLGTPGLFGDMHRRCRARISHRPPAAGASRPRRRLRQPRQHLRRPRRRPRPRAGHPPRHRIQPLARPSPGRRRSRAAYRCSAAPSAPWCLMRSCRCSPSGSP